MTDPTPSANYDIRLLSVEESGNTNIPQYSFDASPQKPVPDDERKQYWPYLEGSRLPHAFNTAGEPVARAAIYPQTMNVRGKLLTSGGVGGVASLPGGRRSGMVRAVMHHSFELMRKDGQAVSGLYPFRESFYQRLGYSGWYQPRWTTVDPAHLHPILKVEKPGEIEWGMIADKWDVWAAFLETFQAQTHGMTLSDEPRRNLVRHQNNRWVVLVRENGQVTGGMSYRITGYHESMIVPNFFPLTVNAEYLLLDWIARHADQVKHARIQVPPRVNPELWLHDLDAPISSTDDNDEAWNAPMARIISIEGLSGIGAGEGEIALEITDDACPWNTGTWTFRASGGELEVTPGGTPAASLQIQALAALLFTGSEPASFVYRGWGFVDPATRDTLRSIFPPVTPYIHDLF